MTQHDFDILDTIGTSEYLANELIEDSDLDIPPHMRPPNPDDSEVLPSQVHPSYPYGNPTSIKHPASRPRRPYDPSSRALFEDMGYGGGGVNGSIRWKDLALDLLLPVDEEKEEAAKAAEARKLASGTAANQPAPPLPPPQPQGQPPEDDDSDPDENDDDDDEDEEGTTEEEE